MRHEAHDPTLPGIRKPPSSTPVLLFRTPLMLLLVLLGLTALPGRGWSMLCTKDMIKNLMRMGHNVRYEGGRKGPRTLMTSTEALKDNNYTSDGGGAL